MPGRTKFVMSGEGSWSLGAALAANGWPNRSESSARANCKSGASHNERSSLGSLLWGGFLGEAATHHQSAEAQVGGAGGE